MRKLIDFEILDTGIILKGVEYIRIFEVFPDNFVLEDVDSRNKFLLSFEQFLLALKFPIQIIAMNSQIKKSEILQYTKNITDDTLKNIYKKNILDLCQNKELFLYTQRFFIIYKVYRKDMELPFKKKVLKARKEILVNDKQIAFLLDNIRVKYKTLKNKKEIISLFKNFI